MMTVYDVCKRELTQQQLEFLLQELQQQVLLQQLALPFLLLRELHS